MEVYVGTVPGAGTPGVTLWVNDEKDWSYGTDLYAMRGRKHRRK